MTERTLDRLEEFDGRSRAYPVRALLGAAPTPRSYTWACAATLDQGREGACVGFAWTHELAARPVVVSEATEALARTIYREAQKVDQWPGESYEGTSVIAGAKVVAARGGLDEYRWAFGLDDALLALGYKGPGVAGLHWYEGMFDTDAKGFIHPTGRVAGGHAILVRGVNVRQGYVLLRNSWGNDWGKGGDCKLSIDDFGRLLREDGEFCVPVRRRRP